MGNRWLMRLIDGGNKVVIRDNEPPHAGTGLVTGLCPDIGQWAMFCELVRLANVGAAMESRDENMAASVGKLNPTEGRDGVPVVHEEESWRDKPSML